MEWGIMSHMQVPRPMRLRSDARSMLADSMHGPAVAALNISLLPFPALAAHERYPVERSHNHRNSVALQRTSRSPRRVSPLARYRDPKLRAAACLETPDRKPVLTCDGRLERTLFERYP